MKNLLRTADLSPEGLRYLLDLAAETKADPYRNSAVLRDSIVVAYFATPSARAWLPFESAIARLGGLLTVVGPQELPLGRDETIEDTARAVAAYARAFIIRTEDDDDVRRFAAAASIPVVNALTNRHHPCQSIADLMTLQERWETLRGRRLAYVGDGTSIAHSLMEGAALARMDIAIATPPGFEPDAEVTARAGTLAKENGCQLVLTHDPIEAVRGADAVYTDVWMPMGTRESERAARTAALRPYQVNAALMRRAAPKALFLHCLPAVRGEEVTADVIDGPRSVVFGQAENFVHAAQAVLLALVEGRLSGVRQAVPAAAPTRRPALVGAA